MPKKSPTTLLVALGNMGANYAHTKHNIGLMALEYIARNYYKVGL